MTGIGVPQLDPHLEYWKCIVFYGEWHPFYDYACLCQGGDGEGSAMIQAAIEGNAAWMNCGTPDFSALEPRVTSEIKYFCHQVLSEAKSTSTTAVSATRRTITISTTLLTSTTPATGASTRA
ncbi:hypothetical protein B0T20DRAFT_143854 [Sordaria brevicollis]|uniref:Uncharacterized protein n=1 Tax=Sordaria brevicollis TaxID=83679 RepID=A0AAE0NRK6_SORBR|nr:hypothetical protein B0T20DRAFT_143854 [Sordaria brevicollis]